MSDVRIATVSLAGCFGCHMSLLDIDEAIVGLADKVRFERSPLTDIKTLGRCDIGIIEGAVANDENVEVLQHFRRQCTTLVAMGACAINGGIPALRNSIPVASCLAESYEHGMGLVGKGIPNDPELPLLLDRVHTVSEVVEVDVFLPGCPPPASLILDCLSALLEGRSFEPDYAQLHYD